MRVQPKRVPSFSSRPGFPNGLRVLLIDPDTSGRQAVQEMLTQCNYAVTPCTSATEAVLQLTKLPNGFDVILAEAKALNPRIKDSTSVKQRARSTPLLLMALNPSPEEVLLGIKLGAVDFLEKPLSPLKLRNIWQHTVRKMMADMDIKGQPESGQRKSGDGSSAASPTHSSSTGSNEQAAPQPASTARMARQASLASSGSAATAYGLPLPSSSQLPSAAALIQASKGLLERVQSHSNASQGSGGSGSSGCSGSHCDSACTPQQGSRPGKLLVKEGAPAQLTSPQGVATPPGLVPPLVNALSPGLPPIPPPPMAPLPPGMVWGMPMTPLVHAPGIVPPTLPAPVNNMPWGPAAAIPAAAAATAAPAALAATPATVTSPATTSDAAAAGAAAALPPASEPAPGSLAADMAAATGCSSLPRISSCISDLAAADLAAGADEDCSMLFPELEGLLWEESSGGSGASGLSAGPGAGPSGLPAAGFGTIGGISTPGLVGSPPEDSDTVLGLKLAKSDSLMDLLSMSLLADGGLDSLLVESAA